MKIGLNKISVFLAVSMMVIHCGRTPSSSEVKGQVTLHKATMAMGIAGNCQGRIPGVPLQRIPGSILSSPWFQTASQADIYVRNQCQAEVASKCPVGTYARAVATAGCRNAKVIFAQKQEIIPTAPPKPTIYTCRGMVTGSSMGASVVVIPEIQKTGPTCYNACANVTSAITTQALILRSSSAVPRPWLASVACDQGAEGAIRYYID